MVCHTINKKCFFLSPIDIHIYTTAFHFTIRYVEVDEEKCVGCGTCFDVCPDFVYEILK